MSLKERILKEMVVDEEIVATAKQIFNQLPTELQTQSNFSEIEKRVKEGKT